ncbi:hypothetical protein ATI61_110214 [Archangium gephyra]|uniref:Lipoprotein n=2 Tax=Archangium gephyra TaxID=48 RepID=A0AAC8TH93_9BACT|nr:Hypothetical protein AA314_07668 [Archangium gephyra]REG27207.1 hypothetical protein ATI61_110214 [Archangium gephyra]
MWMLRTLPVAVLALLLPWRLEAAAPRAKPQENPWVILLGSKQRPAEAQALLASLEEKKPLQWLKPTEGFPKLVASESLPGLAPGLRVLVLGVCGSRETALAARARVLPMVPDAYVKQLSGPAPLACPNPIPLNARLPKGAVQLASVPFKQDKALVLSLYQVNARSVMECKTHDLLFRLEYGREVLTEQTHTGDCTGVCTPEAKQEGEAKVAEIQKRIENDEGSMSELDYNFVECISLTPEFLGVLGGYERPLFFVSSTSLAHHDVPKRTVHPVGVACGELTGSVDGDDSGPYSDPVKYFTHAEARRSTKEGADEHTFDIGVWEQSPGAADGGPPVWKTVATLTEGCDFYLSMGEH